MAQPHQPQGEPIESVPAKFLVSETLGGNSEDEVFDSELLLSQMLGNPALTQYLVRHEIGQDEVLTGYFRCRFSRNQQRYILHVPFFPHFLAAPQVEAAIYDDTPGRVRITDRQKFGSRIEIVLEKPSEQSFALLVEVSASAPFSPVDESFFS